MPTSWFDEVDLTTETGKKQFQAKKMNNLAMASFTMAFTREGIVRLVSKAKTKEWPEGFRPHCSRVRRCDARISGLIDGRTKY
jgi:hypothetical protein